MNKQDQFQVETVPAMLQFHDGRTPGTIYARRLGGRIVEAYRGYGFEYTPIATALRSDPARCSNPVRK